MRWALRITILVTLLALLVLRPSPGEVQANPPYGAYWGGVYHSATAGESYARGVADIIRSGADLNVADSIAARNREEAYSRYLDNRLKAVETYWARRDRYNQRLDYQLYQMRLKSEQKLAPVRLQDLGPHELDLTTGAIAWPPLLREPSFARYLVRLAELFTQRATVGELSMAEISEASELIYDWRMYVTDRMHLYPPETVHQALRFLLRLNRELRDGLEHREKLQLERLGPAAESASPPEGPPPQDFPRGTRWRHPSGPQEEIPLPFRQQEETTPAEQPEPDLTPRIPEEGPYFPESTLPPPASYRRGA